MKILEGSQRKKDRQTIKELQEAGIKVVNSKKNPFPDEVSPVSLKTGICKGKKDSFVFVRGWYYWMVKGYVPLDVAEELYANPVGKKDVRVMGHIGCPPPAEWVYPMGDNGQLVVFRYHIDSQEGLNLFVKTLKERGVIK